MKTSVALCTYNAEKYIAEQLQSILNQTISVDEIIICDDNSKDSTANIIAQFIEQFPKKIKYYQNLTNLGVNKNFEKTIAICQGDYIFLSDQDDIWMPNKVEITLNTFEANPSSEAVFSNALLINDDGKNFTSHTLWSAVGFLEEKLKKPIDLFFLLKHASNMVTGATLCFKKTLKEIILPIPNIKNCYHDEWIAILSASRKTLFYSTDKLISYRIHSSQQIGTGGEIKDKRINTFWNLTQHLVGYNSPRSYKDYRNLSNNYFRRYKLFKNLYKANNELAFLNGIAKENLDLFLKSENQLKKCNPIFYYLRQIKDKLKGKRQIKNSKD